MNSSAEGGEKEFDEDIGVSYNEKTIFGGILAFLAWSLLIAEFGLAMDTIFW